MKSPHSVTGFLSRIWMRRDGALFERLLTEAELHPVLVDIGASGSPPALWESINATSIYIGFDPDLREMHESSHASFFKEFIINEALTDDPSKHEVLFHLTRSPFCSSTLKPDLKSLAEFHYQDYFITEQEVMVSATTLDTVLERLSLDRVDWLKCDTQGIDLRIFSNLSESVRSGVLALDIEPGLIDAYEGEDLFVDAHRYLPSQGFWLSNLDVYGAVRMRKSTLTSMISDESLGYLFADRALKKTPGWCEARYLRTLSWLAERNYAPNDYLLLWIFALLDAQFGFAMDVATEYERRFGRDERGQTMHSEAAAHIDRLGLQLAHARLRSFAKKATGRLTRAVP